MNSNARCSYGVACRGEPSNIEGRCLRIRTGTFAEKGVLLAFTLIACACPENDATS